MKCQILDNSMFDDGSPDCKTYAIITSAGFYHVLDGTKGLAEAVGSDVAGFVVANIGSEDHCVNFEECDFKDMYNKKILEVQWD